MPRYYRRRRTPLYRRYPVGGFGFPAQKIVPMRYQQSFLAGPSPSVVRTLNYWRAGSIYDPDFTGGGHQPLGHDQWAPFYDHYVVVSSKASITVGLNVGQPGRAINFGIFLADATGAIGDFRPIMESGRGGWSTIAAGAYAGSDNQKSVSAYFSAKDFYGVSNISDNVDRLGAQYGADPTEDAYFAVWTETADQNVANEATALTITLTINYLVYLSEPKTLPLS